MFRHILLLLAFALPSHGLAQTIIGFAKAQASYDAATGPAIRTPVQRPDPDTGGFAIALMSVTINRATGEIRVNL